MRKPTYRDLLKCDKERGTSLVRELEMAVDAVIDFAPMYCIQFFKDADLYSLQEARTYLVNFVAEKIPEANEEQAKKMAKFSSVFESVFAEVTRQ